MIQKICSNQELYGEILKSFYFGQFTKYDRFLTQKETQEYYGVSRSAVEKAFKMLQRDGFLTSQRHHGSVVMFDHNNPAHLAKVPLCQHNPAVRELYTFDFPLMMLTRIIYESLCRASEQQLERHRLEGEEILRCLDAGEACSDKVKEWHFHIVEDMQNAYLSKIFNHFLSRYLYINSERNMTRENWKKLKACIRKFYVDFLVLLEEKDFERFIPLKQAYYESVYQIPNALVFSQFGEERIFQESAQYSKLLHKVLFLIQANGLRKGDFLPTIAQLCQRYHVSAKTVRNTYDILAEIGLIDRKRRRGTVLIANPYDAEIKNWIVKRFGAQKNDYVQLFDALILIGDSILRNTVSQIRPSLLIQMRTELDEQHRDAVNNHLPYLVVDVLVTPVVMSLPTGVLHKYYFYLQKPTAAFVNLCGLEHGEELQNSEEVYDLLCLALDALQCGDSENFIAYAKQAQRINEKLLMRICGEALSRWDITKRHFPPQDGEQSISAC